MAQVSDQIRHAGGNAPLERTRDLRLWPIANAIPNNCLEERTKVEFAPVVSERICVRIGGVARELLKPDRGLSFKCALSHKTEQSSCRIEESAHGCRRKSTDPM